MAFNRKNYDNSSDDILTELLGDTLFSQALCPIVIPTYSLIAGSPNLFTSRACTDTNNKIDYFMRDIAGATSAAPTYFPPKEFKDSTGHLHIEAE